MPCGCGKKDTNSVPVSIPAPVEVLKVPMELNLTPELLKLKK